MFTNALVRTPGKSLINGISTSKLGLPDYGLALNQHRAYIKALEECGLKVTILPPLENYPDSTFIEDVALLTPKCAIITNPGAQSRKGETAGMREILSSFYNDVEVVQDPGTVEGGDIMMVGSHFYIGISDRTNGAGAQQVIGFLKKYGLSGSTIALKEVLHLKTALSYLENDNLVACGEMLNKEEFIDYNILPIGEDESYAANCIWVNGAVLVAKGFPYSQKTIRGAGYPIIEVDVSEFRKLDGGLSCLSLRF